MPFTRAATGINHPVPPVRVFYLEDTVNYRELEDALFSVGAEVSFSIPHPDGGFVFITAEDVVDLISGMSVERLQHIVVDRYQLSLESRSK